jgi:hypothetical protein
VVDQQYVEEILALGHEVRSFEVKGPGSITDKAFVAKVARAAMAMGNLRDGGQVCLGIENSQFAKMLPGLTANQVAEWSHYDNVSDQLARYSDPPVTFHIKHFVLTSGANVIIFDVDEFETDIHVCKKDFSGELQTGQTYVRPRGKPRTAKVPSLAEMHELHTLAIDKGVREFIRRAGAAGIPLLGASAPSPDVPVAAHFGNEANQGWADTSSVDEPAPGTLVDYIVAPAYTDVTLRPGPYKEDRIRPDELPDFITDRAVRLRGWPVPMISSRNPIARHGTWIGQDLQAEVVPHIEAWRLFTSGQFLHRRVVATDLRDAAQLRPEAPGATGAIAVWDVLLYLVEVAELGARFATSLGVDTIAINVSLENIAGRELISGTPERELDGLYISSAKRFTASISLDVPALLVAPRAAGVDLTQQILRQFGLNVSDTILDQWQNQILDSKNR